MAEDGEVLSSAAEGEEDEGEERPCKRLKLDEEQSLEEGDEWMTVVRGPKPRTNTNEEGDEGTMLPGKKRKRNRVKSYNDDILGEATPPLAVSDQTKKYLSVIQAKLLQSLMGGAGGGVSETEYKTADMQAIVLHVLLGSPAIRRKKKAIVRTNSLPSTDELTKKKVIIVWLSSLSRHDVTINSESFAQLRSLPFFQTAFNLKNPGNEKFVQFGLEAFMEIENSSNSTIKKQETVPQEFTRKDCLLSYQQLVENEYPLPPLETDTGTESLESDYVMLGTWPAHPIESNVDSSYPLFAIDCEMVKTEGGSELARVSVINEDLACIYTSLVKPDKLVLDYLTRFSGVDEEMLQDVSVRLSDVQAKLTQLLPSNAILIGHSLENDLLALKLWHPYVIDTALLFTPSATPRCKPGLKVVAKKLLKKSIQSNEASGHDPTEDASTCMELVKRKLREGRDCVIEWRESKLWLPVHLNANGVSSCVIDKHSMASLYAGRTESCYVSVTSDSEAVANATERFSKNNFIFIQLHSMEVLKKTATGYTDEEFTCTLTELDKLCCNVVAASPSDSLIMVVCGSGHIGEVRDLQKDPNTHPNVLKDAVMKAREGKVFVLLK